MNGLAPKNPHRKGRRRSILEVHMLSPLGWFMLAVGIVGLVGFVFVAGAGA